MIVIFAGWLNVGLVDVDAEVKGGLAQDFDSPDIIAHAQIAAGCGCDVRRTSASCSRFKLHTIERVADGPWRLV